jgi:glycine oxidase
VTWDAVFVGGGVIGLSGAWRAARSGLRVAVVDPEPGHGASWVAAGMLAPVTEAHFGEERLVALLVEGAARWSTFAGELEADAGIEIGYRRCGTVLVALDASDRAVVDELLALQHSLGLEATRLSGRACRELVPALAPGIRGGAAVPADHQVDNRRLVTALVTALARTGTAMVTGRATEVTRGPSGSADGVRLDDGTVISAGSVVLCAGAETAGIAGVPAGTIPPVRPVKGQVVRLRGADTLVPRTVRGLVRGRPCYLVPREDGSLVVGATIEERGFDRTVQAGAVHALLDDARALVPGIDELELVECQAGLRPGSPDNAPSVGWTEIPGLAVATGHFRNGILLAPLTAEALDALLRGDPVPPALQGFGPDRWATGPGRRSRAPGEPGRRVAPDRVPG